MDICNKLECGIPAKSLMEEYKIGRSTLYDIKAQKNDLLKYQSKGDKTGEKRKIMKKLKNEDLDEVLYHWFQIKRAEGVPMSGPMICEKAKWFQERLNIGVEQKQLKFSQGWLLSFKERHGIRRLDVSGEKRSADAEAAIAYADKFAELISKNNLTPERVYNADETRLMWRCIPEEMLAAGAEKSASGFKKNKERLTEEITDSDLIERVLNPTLVQEIILEEEDEIEEDTTSEVSSWSEAIDMLSKLIKFTVRKPCFDSKTVMQFCIAKNLFEIKRHEQIKQADIRSLFKKQPIKKKKSEKDMPSTSTEIIMIKGEVASSIGSDFITEPIASRSAVKD